MAKGGNGSAGATGAAGDSGAASSGAAGSTGAAGTAGATGTAGAGAAAAAGDSGATGTANAPKPAKPAKPPRRKQLRTAIVIPYRDRGTDPLRAANLHHILKHWATFPADVHVIDDGRVGTEQFNRSAAYNRGRTAAGNVDIIVYAEADMILGHHNLQRAIDRAKQPGLVVPFTEYRYLSPRDSELVRSETKPVTNCAPQQVMKNGTSIGAINVVSQQTLDLVGQWDEHFEGSWWDDTAMKRAFDIAAAPTRWITGPAWHLYHLPGWTGDHLTDADKAATIANQNRWGLYKEATTATEIRNLTAGAATM